MERHLPMWQKKLRLLGPKQTRSCFFPARGGPTGCPTDPERAHVEKRRLFLVVESSSGLLALFLRQLIGNSCEAFTAILEKSARDAAWAGRDLPRGGPCEGSRRPRGANGGQPVRVALILGLGFWDSRGSRKRRWAGSGLLAQHQFEDGQPAEKGVLSDFTAQAPRHPLAE